MQADNAENAAEELESRRRRAEFLKRLRAATQKQLDELLARLESLEAKAQGMQAYTMTISDKLVRLLRFCVLLLRHSLRLLAIALASALATSIVSVLHFSAASAHHKSWCFTSFHVV